MFQHWRRCQQCSAAPGAVCCFSWELRGCSPQQLQGPKSPTTSRFCTHNTQVWVFFFKSRGHEILLQVEETPSHPNSVTDLNAAIFFPHPLHAAPFPRSSPRRAHFGSPASDPTNHLSFYFRTWPLLSGAPSAFLPTPRRSTCDWPVCCHHSCQPQPRPSLKSQTSQKALSSQRFTFH